MEGVINANNIEEFKESVAQNGGYYIARYEASLNATTEKAMSKISTTYEGEEVTRKINKQYNTSRSI